MPDPEGAELAEAPEGAELAAPEGAELAELRARVVELEKEVELLRSRPAQPGLDAGMAEDLLAELRTASQGRRRLLTQLLQVLGTDVDHLS